MMYNQRISMRGSILLTLIFIFTTNENLLNGAAGSSFKYSHSPLVAALNGGGAGGIGGGSGGLLGIRTSRDYGTKTTHTQVAGNTVSTSAAGVGGGGGGGETDGGGGLDAAVSSSENVGEVLASKTFPLSPQEPTCEQLRAMWIFSKRQSRAAEITNEIPTYRDPFAYNVWEPYFATTRSSGNVRTLPHFAERLRSPVFGRVISREPILPQRIGVGAANRQRHLGDLGGATAARIYGSENKPINGGAATGLSRRPTQQYRYIGANGSGGGVTAGNRTPAGVGGNQNSAAVQGSFQKLKELIWTERAKDLTQQRRAEELAARAAVLKEIANGQNIQPSYKNAYKSESPLMDENRSPDRDIYQHINDGRMSIASGQWHTDSNNSNNNSKSSNNNNNNNNNKSNNKHYGKTSSTRSFANKFGGNGMHKSPVFTTKQTARGYPGVHTGRVIPSSYPLDERLSNIGGGGGSGAAGGGSITGVPKIYPLRPSHFRERNRSLFNQHSPAADYFQRDVRNNNKANVADIPTAIAAEELLLKTILNNLYRRRGYQQHSTKGTTKLSSDSNNAAILYNLMYDNDDDNGIKAKDATLNNNENMEMLQIAAAPSAVSTPSWNGGVASANDALPDEYDANDVDEAYELGDDADDDDDWLYDMDATNVVKLLPMAQQTPERRQQANKHDILNNYNHYY